MTPHAARTGVLQFMVRRARGGFGLRWPRLGSWLGAPARTGRSAPRHGAGLAALAAAAILAAQPHDAAAFWPLTRSWVDTKPDSALEARIDRRWDRFQVAPSKADSARRDSTAAKTPANPGPKTYISRANSNEVVTTEPATPGPAVGETATAAPDSAPTAPPAGPFADVIAKARARADSIAAAGGDAAGSDANDSMDSMAGAGNFPGGTTTGGMAGNGATTSPAAAAAARAAARQAALTGGWQPVLTSRMTLNSDTQDTGVDMKTSFSDPSGVVLSNSLGYHDVLSLLRKQELETHSLMNSLTIPLRAKGFTFGVSTNNTRSTQASQATTGNALSTFTDNKGAQASMQLSRALLDIPGLSAAGDVLRGISVNATAAVDYTASRNDQNTSNRVGSSSNKHEGSGRSVGAGGTFDRLKWLTFHARTGRLRRANDDSIEQIRQLGAPPERTESNAETSGDTTSVDINVPTLWKVQTLTVGFRTSNGIDTRPENATNSSGSSQGTGFQFETTRTYSRSFDVSAKAQPLRGLDMSLTLQAARDSTGYAIKRLSFTDTDRQNWKLENHLMTWGQGLVTCNYESSVSNVNRDVFNPQTTSLEKSPQTRRDETRKLYTEYAKALTATLKTKWSYEIQLDQGFYKHPGASGGLSDVDQLRRRAALDVSGEMAGNAVGQISMYYRTLDKAYIDPSQSSLSKNESEYVVRPSYTWTINERTTVSQRFSLESKVLDDVFKPENSTLDRNHTMNTALKYDLTPRLHLDTQYDYGLQDNGSYVRVYGLPGRYYTPLRRTKKDQITLNARCDVLADGKLALVSQQVSTRTRRLNRVTAATGLGAPVNEQHALTLGVESALEISGAKLNCRLRWTNNNFSGSKKSYADGNATFEWSF